MTISIGLALFHKTDEPFQSWGIKKYVVPSLHVNENKGTQNTFSVHNLCGLTS
jgi:hypothetical protein